MWETKWRVRAVVALAALGIACQRTEIAGLTQDQADRIMTTYLEARRDASSLDLLDQIFDPAVVVHDCGAPDEIRGIEALKTYYAESHAGLPDFRITCDEVLVAHDRIICRWTVTGTHTETLRGLPATGKSLRFSGVAIDRVANGMIVEEWVDYDMLNLMRQLGFTLQPPGVATGT